LGNKPVPVRLDQVIPEVSKGAARKGAIKKKRGPGKFAKFAKDKARQLKHKQKLQNAGRASKKALEAAPGGTDGPPGGKASQNDFLGGAASSAQCPPLGDKALAGAAQGGDQAARSLNMLKSHN
jgi:hypothetical protein